MANEPSRAEEYACEAGLAAYGAARKAVITGAVVAGTAVGGPVGGVVAGAAAVAALNRDTITRIIDANRKKT